MPSGHFAMEGSERYNRHLAGWQSGYAADCKSAYAGSIPTSASKTKAPLRRGFFLSGPVRQFLSANCHDRPYMRH